ncbi:MAG: hypothetical protein RBR69_06925, partial [Candidatus Cloacimonadaceae bacterium]|nr:hypothetical protein [Candidatus Cloacimonadaceae bacterium]
MLDARRIQSSKQAISAEFNKSVQQIRLSSSVEKTGFQFRSIPHSQRERIYPGIPYLWRKLDCRRLACRARDVLIFKALGLAGCETHPIQQAGHFSGFIQGIPYLWRKLDCRRLACRARDVLIFKALGLAGCETHPIQQAGHFSG